jgi:hypothetical protein
MPQEVVVWSIVQQCMGYKPGSFQLCSVEYLRFQQGLLNVHNNNNVIVIIQFNSLFIYVLSSAANGHLESQHECKQEQWDNTGQNEQKHQKKK